MEFPSYVPHAVRVSMAARLEGDGKLGGGDGWTSALASAEAELLRVQKMQQDYAHDEAVSNTLRVEVAKQRAHRDHIAAEVACCQRLVHDARMQPVYALLVSLPNVTDPDLSGFIYAAWAARMDYAKNRERVKAAADLAREVAKAAGALAEVLRKAEGFVGPYLPSEFFSIQSLLEKTDHDFSDRNFYMWQGRRRFILGEPPPPLHAAAEPGPEPGDKADPPAIKVRFFAIGEAGPPIDPAQANRHALRYAWGTAPSMARIIATMQREALDYVPTADGAIGAALASQKSNRKFEYLRAFGALLRDVPRIELTADTMKAMAATAIVVLNEPDLDVSHDDVRKALATIAA